METEQPISKFRKTPQMIITPASDIETAADTSSFYYESKSSDKVEELSKKVISNSYRLIDSISGYPSRLLVNIKDDYQFQRLHDVLELLKTKKIIKWSIFGDTRYNDAPFFHRLDIIPDYEKGVTDGKELDKPLGHGFGKNTEVIFSKAIGEILERYFLTIYRKKNLLRSSSSALKNKKLQALDLNLLAGFSEKQKKSNLRLQFNEESIFYWEKTKRVSTDEITYLPAQTVYWNYHNEFEPFLCEGNTNGAGGFFTKEGAILSGLYELIQRDSFLIYWLNKLTPRSIDPKTIPGEDFQNLLEESERYGFEIFCLDVTADTGVPAFVAIVSDPLGKSPRFSLGGGCQSNPAEALHRAFEEAWSVYYWMRPRPAFPVLSKDYQPFKEKIGQDERLRLWSNPEMADYFKFLVSGKKESFADINFDYPKEFASQKEELDFLTKRVESLGPGYEVYYHQPRYSILSEVGYCSVQVVVPQFIPLFLNETNAPLGSRRLKETPSKLGFKTAEEFNPFPHPFP